jgi:hypothetical protein
LGIAGDLRTTIRALLALVLGPWLAAKPQAQEMCAALVIADAYQDASPLTNPLSDAKARDGVATKTIVENPFILGSISGQELDRAPQS